MSDAKYLKWLRTKPCMICGQFREYRNGAGVSQAAHVRLFGRGGVGMKPPYSAVPLCSQCHGLQHNKSHEIYGNKEWWINKADFYLEAWLHGAGSGVHR